MRYSLLGCLLSLAACATPTVRYEVASGQGNVEGVLVRSLPQARITIAPPDANSAPEDDAEGPTANAGTTNMPTRRASEATPPAHASPASHAAPHGNTTAAPAAAAATADTNNAGNSAPAIQRAAGKSPEFSVDFEDNPRASYLVRARNSALATTRLAPTYHANSTITAGIDVETVDHSQELASDVASIISAVGDPTILRARNSNDGGVNTSVSCLFIDPQYIAARLGVTGEQAYAPLNGGEDAARYRVRLSAPVTAEAINGLTGCSMTIGFGRVSDDAVTRLYFDQHLAGRDAHFWVGAACRPIIIDYGINGVQTHYVGYVPDPNFVRLTPLPYKGKLDETSVCAAPSLTEADTPAPTGLHLFSGMLDPFRNGGGAGTPAPASGGDSGGGSGSGSGGGDSGGGGGGSGGGGRGSGSTGHGGGR